MSDDIRDNDANDAATPEGATAKRPRSRVFQDSLPVRRFA